MKRFPLIALLLSLAGGVTADYLYNPKDTSAIESDIDTAESEIDDLQTGTNSLMSETNTYVTTNDTRDIDLTGSGRVAVPTGVENDEAVTKNQLDAVELLATNAVALDEIDNPGGNVNFNMANKQLKLTYVAPATADGALEVEASGGFTGDLLHLHQHSGNPNDTHGLHIEGEDADFDEMLLNVNAAAYAVSVLTGLVDIGNNTIYNMGIIYDGEGSGAGITFSTQTFFDSSGNNSFDWENRELLDSAGSKVIDWTTILEVNTALDMQNNAISNAVIAGVPTVITNSLYYNFPTPTNGSRWAWIGPLTHSNDFTALEGSTRGGTSVVDVVYQHKTNAPASYTIVETGLVFTVTNGLYSLSLGLDVGYFIGIAPTNNTDVLDLRGCLLSTE